MKKYCLTWVLFISVGFLVNCCKTLDHAPLFVHGKTIPIVISTQASDLERFAAQELQRDLAILYPHIQFPLETVLPANRPALLLGTQQSMPELRSFVSDMDVQTPESFVVTRSKDKGQALGIIAGADPQGVLYGAYAILEEMGFGFYLSYESHPAPQKGPFELTAWNIKDTPLVPERFALNWHNFLSGCSSWNLEDWQTWISSLAKMRFNTMMVHAYGNNPMETFSLNGETKPVGSLSTSLMGRDWGTEHVNDVRRLFGGKEIFDGAVFGSSAALVPEAQRSTAAIELMQKVFAFADTRGMKILFALDVDTLSGNPQNIIQTLPPSARLTVHGSQVANPDLPEGFAFYEARIKSLIQNYPQIDQIALWFRRNTDDSLGTIWRTIHVDEFTPEWKNEYLQKVDNRQEVANDPESPSMFAIAKMTQACRKALDSLNRKDISLSVGSWGFQYLPAAQEFLPKEVKLISLDYDVNIVDPTQTQSIVRVSRNHPVVPVVWAHHDDHTYMGRPYTPFPNFGSYLTQNQFPSLGIIHWTMRPLDLYFKSLAQQVWKRSLDEPIHRTCMDMAQRSFGLPFRESMGEYLVQWIHHAPMFGRETTDAFIDRPLKNGKTVIEECQKRRSLLSDVDPYSMTPEAKDRLQYAKSLEDFFIQFYQSQSALERCKEYVKKFQIYQAYETLKECKPESVIENYAQLSQIGGISAGEKGLLVSLNLRWYPYFMGLRQSMREEPIRVNFQPTHNDPLAQAPGKNTFFIDAKGRWWVGMGTRETGLDTFTTATLPESASPAYQEIGQTGILIPQKSQIRILPFAESAMPSGGILIRLFFVEPELQNPGQRVFDLQMWEESSDRSRPVPFVKDRIDILQRTGKPNRVLDLSYKADIQHGALVIELDPIRGSALLCGVMIVPDELQPRKLF